MSHSVQVQITTEALLKDTNYQIPREPTIMYNSEFEKNCFDAQTSNFVSYTPILILYRICRYLRLKKFFYNSKNLNCIWELSFLRLEGEYWRSPFLSHFSWSEF